MYQIYRFILGEQLLVDLSLLAQMDEELAACIMSAIIQARFGSMSADWIYEEIDWLIKQHEQSRDD